MNIPIIRLAKKEDIQQLVILCKEHATYEKTNYDESHKEKLLSEHLFPLNENIKCLVVEQNGRLLGYSTILKQFSTWDANFYFYMDCLFLTEEARGKGLGSMMMKELKKYALKKNYNLQWQTPYFNTNAIEFYNALGAEHNTKERFFWNII
ncbi:GNAT family N-acetyltransferase [uncultured Aquimarina sp.]|uniref:GNAT family N-acetyltransferase n=1 Tax=uncultured Aquimarina sp. TaxID=575652 RepID=UPI0026364988|nr:GNAT family N-acetyltransferase [uncultured Aquimarina sp.]